MYYYIDIGSSTIKVYSKIGAFVSKVTEQTFDFKNKFDPVLGLSKSNLNDMYSFFRLISKKYAISRTTAKLFATGIFRDLVNKNVFIDSFYVNTGLFFNIIGHDLETYYLEKAWIGRYNDDKPIMIINIGGRTTELIIFKKGVSSKRYELDLGVGTVLKEYPFINRSLSEVSIDLLVDSIIDKLPTIDTSDIDIAIYTGGELTYMILSGYKLIANDCFYDDLHPSMISSDNYFIRNEQIYSQITLTELRELMPNNPNWMNGARACSAIAQAICMKYGIYRIIPSDSNLIDGVNVQSLRSVVVCGSFNRHLKRISRLIKKLKGKGINILSPINMEVVGSEKEFVLFKHDKLINNCTWHIEKKHIDAIIKCDCVIICNYDNYIGYSTAKELGIALMLGKKVIFIEDNEISQEEDSPIEVGLF